MYLVDTNVWLERLLDQSKSEEVGIFLDRTSSELLYITDFGFHSIGVVMGRLGRMDALSRFVRDAFIVGSVGLIHLEPEDTDQIARNMERYKLDFDDAYQYVAAEKGNLTIVSLDGDFDRTSKGRKTPAQAIKE